MADSAHKSTRMTLREFLAWEEAQPGKYEFIGGLVRAMAGGTQAHATIAGNIFAALHNKLRGKPCRPVGSDMKVVAGEGQSFYPDVTVDCSPLAANATLAGEPRIIFEVLSPSTRDSDFSDKLPAYQGVVSIEQILFFEPGLMHVHVWTRLPDKTWSATEAARPDASLELPSIGVTLDLQDLYAGLN